MSNGIKLLLLLCYFMNKDEIMTGSDNLFQHFKGIWSIMTSLVNFLPFIMIKSPLLSITGIYILCYSCLWKWPGLPMQIILRFVFIIGSLWLSSVDSVATIPFMEREVCVGRCCSKNRDWVEKYHLVCVFVSWFTQYLFAEWFNLFLI